MTASEIVGLLLRVNLALAAGVVLSLMLRAPMRRLAGARAAYRLWLLAPVAGAAVMVPARTSIVAASGQVGQALLVFGPAGTPTAFNAMAAVLVVWLIGAGLVAAWLAWRQRQFLRLADRGEAGPAAVGVVRPRMVLPADFETRFTAEERRAVIAHEHVHIAAQHPRINAVIGASQALFWFNPLVHLGAHVSRLDQELACDEAVVASAPALRRPYAEALLKTQLDATPLPLGCYWPPRGDHPLTQRIAMLARPLPRRATRLSAAAFVVVVTAGAGLAAWAVQPPQQIAATAQVETPVSSTRTAPVQATTIPAEVVIAQTQTVRPGTVPVKPLEVGTGHPFALPNVVTMPDWIERPQAADLVQFYPAEALRASVSGMARIECGVSGDGRLENCAVATETPEGAGFGEAALHLAPMFQMRPMSRDGQPVAGGKVVIPIRFAVN